jgi:sulfate transport system ATP-binding protein
MTIEVRNLSKSFAAFLALDRVNLRVETGELVALLGPSGSGKTTLLRVIAGLEFPDRGEVLLDGRDMTAQNAPARRVGFVFQHYALFRHMTVFENVAFGLSIKPRRVRPPTSQIHARVWKLLKLVQLDAQADRYPSQLSGGQRQRVALARALAVEPKVLLLDEPFGALDAKVRLELRRWLRRLHHELRITSVLVTHDQEEALEVADRVAIMNRGHIEQVGTPEEVYHRPASAFVYEFLGNFNLFHARLNAWQTGSDALGDGPLGGSADRPIVYVRPHLLHIERQPGGQNRVVARVERINSAGPLVKVQLATDTGETLEAAISHDRYAELQLRKDDAVYVSPRELKAF